MRIEEILKKIFLEKFILTEDTIEFNSKIYKRKDNFLDLLEQIESKEQSKVASSFGKEWQKFDTQLEEYKKEFFNYFDIVPNSILEDNILVADLGCGKGRWSYEFLKKNKNAVLVLIDISKAIEVAKINLEEFKDRVIFIRGDILKLPLKEDAFDFLFSLGVIHHIPGNLKENLKEILKLSQNSLIYLYYSLDNRGIFFKILFYLINLIRLFLSKFSYGFLRAFFSKIILFFIYLPLIYFSILLKKFRVNVSSIPLSYYAQNFSKKRIEQDVYDRFFTHIEKRISKKEIQNFCFDNNFNVIVSEKEPFWHFLVNKNNEK